MLGWLRALWRKREKSGPPTEVVLYTRRDCCLCDGAWHVLEKAQKSYPLDLRQIDVDDDPQLQTAYGLMVPVVIVNGRVRFSGRINPVLLERLLRSESRASSRKV